MLIVLQRKQREEGEEKGVCPPIPNLTVVDKP